MSPVRVAAEKRAVHAWNDTRLVKECLQGNEEAWSLLIDKYKALIYSIPVKYGLPSQEAADVFQATCAELLVRLPKLREPRALPKWLMQVVQQTQEEQMLREAMASLTPQCRKLVDLLFFETPARPYADVARELGLAVGSIGFTRQKCMDRLRRQLDILGFL